jgi:hypothetical protein
MTEIVPDFQAYCKQYKPPPHNDLSQHYPTKLPTRIREEPSNVSPWMRLLKSRIWSAENPRLALWLMTEFVITNWAESKQNTAALSLVPPAYSIAQ